VNCGASTVALGREPARDDIGWRFAQVSQLMRTGPAPNSMSAANQFLRELFAAGERLHKREVDRAGFERELDAALTRVLAKLA
jgi:hypothetical protein